MTTRELPASEWHRLKGTDLELLVATRPESVIAIVVVEDESGAIVGQWAIATFVHVEGVEIRTDHRNGGVVARRLLAGMREALAVRDIDGVLTGADRKEVGVLLEKVGAVPVMQTYYWPQRSEAERIGARFHKTFETSTGHAPDHPPMPEHDRAVGEAIMLAFSGPIAIAERRYNEWAHENGFAPAVFVMHDGERIIVDSGPYQFTIAPSGICEVRALCQ